MKKNPLGRTGLFVSELCLGSMTWGTQNTTKEGHAQIDLALERGVNFIDTAEMYPVNPVSAETVGGTEEITIVDLAEKIVKATGSTSSIELIPYEEAFEKDFEDMQRRVPGIEKIKALIGFEPKTSLDEIIRQVVEYTKKEKA